MSKEKIENIIFWSAILLFHGLFYLGFDEASMALTGILMLVYGVKSIKERNAPRAVTLLLMGALLFTVALLMRLGIVS
jgi:hypothetical protein